MSGRKENSDRAAFPASHMEPRSCDASLGAEKVARLDSPCSIHFHSIRHRLADADGISGKAALDGLVHAGVLQDDSAKYVSEVTFTQEVGKTEKTIVSITINSLPTASVVRDFGEEQNVYDNGYLDRSK